MGAGRLREDSASELDEARLRQVAAAPARVDVIDAVRGMALFGVLVVNALTTFRVSMFLHVSPDEMSGFGRLVSLSLEMKALIVFSLLFGIGIAAQAEQVRGRSSFARYISRRLFFLLAVGVVHLLLIWNGDILTLYATLGFIAAPLCARLSSRALLAIALGLFIVQVAPLPYPAPFPTIDAMNMHVETANHVYPFGSYSVILGFRLSELRPVSALLLHGAPRTLGLFLLGAVLWRARVFRRAHQRKVTIAAALLLFAGASATYTVRTKPIGGILHEILDDWGAIILALGYVATLVSLFHAHSLFRRALSIFTPVGKLAFTSYLTQSIALSIIFYGYGFGQFAMLDEVTTMKIVLLLFAVQLAFAHAWLARFRYGPLEWLWRSFNYGKWQRLTKNDDAS